MTRIACVAFLLLGAGCRSGVDSGREAEALINTDRAWSQVASAGANADSVVTFWSENASVAMPGAPVVRGKNALRSMVISSFAAPGFHITWTPESAVISKSGDLGYTTGSNEIDVPDPAGKVTKIVGRYLTVWRRESDGRWRCVEDYTTPGPAEAPPRS